MTNGEKILQAFPNAKINYWSMSGVVSVHFTENEVAQFSIIWWKMEYKENNNVSQKIITENQVEY